MSTESAGSPPRPPLYEELERQVKSLSEENEKLRRELAEARRKNEKFVSHSLVLYRDMESLLVENDGS